MRCSVQSNLTPRLWPAKQRIGGAIYYDGVTVLGEVRSEDPNLS